ncbi:hypothetical protein LIER_01222 [Lithospermum erythrorhizon]|uniref:C2H2-type domain-containing protein n=1 Tax=Lithospermum erythrorhizon TaxID=34254 RepID=A0AAV3NK81_LITER
MKLADFEDDDEDQKEGGKELNTNKKETDEGEVKSHQRIVCPICNKTFSSGKAFGGHKSSAHVQSKGQKSCSKKLIKRKYNNNNNNNSAKFVVGDDDFIDEDGDYYYYSERLIEKTGLNKMRKIGITCHHCEKDFPSKKALFGHMRCHPDRPYRGMEAPDSSNLNDDDVDIENSPIISHDGKCEVEEEVEEEEADEINQENDMGVGTSEVAKATKVVDLAQDLVGVGWFRKGRRGGGDETVANSSSAMMDNKSDSISNNQIYQHCSDDSFEECRLASHLLIYLHNSGGSKSNPDEERVAEAIPMASQSEGMELFLDFAMSKKTVEKSEQSSNEEAEVAGVINQLKKNKGKSKAILENGLDDDDNNSSDDTDSDDELVRKLDYAKKGKGISLGKKKRISKYNNDKKVIIKWNKLSSSSAGDNVDYHDISPPSAAAPPPPPHSATENGKEFRCSSCGKTFPTHQALGGHKSSHNKFRMNIHNTIDDEVLPSGSSSRTVVRHSHQKDNNNEDIKNMICDESPSSKGRRISKKRKKAAVEVQKMLDFDLNQLPEEDCSHADDESCM